MQAVLECEHFGPLVDAAEHMVALRLLPVMTVYHNESGSNLGRAPCG
jgi:hypothetical protein